MTPWKNLIARVEYRRRWLLQWLGAKPVAGIQWLTFQVLRLFPVAMVSTLGGWLGRLSAHWVYPDGLRTAKANLRWLEPSWTETRIHDVAMRQFENAGRLKTEFAIMHRLMGAGRIDVENAEAFEAARSSGPVVLAAAHVGNWETLVPLLASLETPVLYIYEPQPDALQMRLAMQVREACATPGSVFVTRDADALRRVLDWLAAGGTMVIFCDEDIKGDCYAPFFGRPPRVRGNYSFAVRFAQSANATLLPVHVVRHHGCRFTARFGSPVHLAATDGGRRHAIDGVVRLNDALEPIVRANLDSWWYLGWRFSGVDYASIPG